MSARPANLTGVPVTNSGGQATSAGNRADFSDGLSLPRLGEIFAPEDLADLNVRSFFLSAAAACPTRPFIATRSGTYSYSRVRELAIAAAYEFEEMGIASGDHVGFIVENSVDFIVRWLGLAMIGGVLVAVDPRLKRPEVLRLLDHAAPSQLVVGPETSEATEAAALWASAANAGLLRLEAEPASQAQSVAALEPPDSPIDPEDPIAVIYTSGTTGEPKGVVQTHGNYVLTGKAYPWWLQLREGNRLYVCLPLCHINAQAYSVMGAIGMHGSVALVPRFSASKFWSDLREFEADAFNFIGVMIVILLKQPPTPEDRSHSARVAYGVPSLPPTLRSEFEDRFGLTVIAGYGMSETTFGMIEDIAGDRRPLSIGKLRRHPDSRFTNEARVVGTDGRDVVAGEVGELWLRNPAVMNGYFGDAARTAQAFAGGWLHTGDLVRFDSDGFFYFIDRIGHMIRHKGENVSSAEIEGVITAHPEVEGAAVVGVESEFTDQDIVGFVELKKRAAVTEPELRAWCGEHLAPFKVPQHLLIIESLPKTATQKVQKDVLKTLARETVGLRVRGDDRNDPAS